MTQNWNWLGFIFLGMFGLGAIIIFVALILTIVWYMIPSKKHRHHNH